LREKRANSRCTHPGRFGVAVTPSRVTRHSRSPFRLPFALVCAVPPFAAGARLIRLTGADPWGEV
jgi:hypothetical protein